MTDDEPPSRTNFPALSVVMPVHNALPYLDQAVASILGQSFTEFEFVILNDASTDGSGERLRTWEQHDRRIRLIEVSKNLGPVESSNYVVEAARAPLVARMDADDISHPERLAREIEVLLRRSTVGLVASFCDIIDSEGKARREAEVWRLAKPSPFVPFAHGSIMYRRQLFDRIGGYRKETEFWEDYDLVTRMAATTKIAIIPRLLFSVRQSGASTRIVSDQDRVERALNRFYRVSDQVAGGERNPNVHEPSEASGKLDPRVFVAAGSLRLWAGGRPRLLGRVISRAKLGFNRLSALTLVWAMWAWVSPATLRTTLLIILRARNRLARRRIPLDRLLLWKPMQKIAPLQPETGQ